MPPMGQENNIKDDFPDDIFKNIRKLIYDKSGISFADSKKYFIKNRIIRRMEECKLKTYQDYYKFLNTADTLAKKKEITSLINAITVNETYFFRDEAQLEIFGSNLFPMAANECKELGRRELKIWSAGCSTGEEPYTIALLFLEKIKPVNRGIDLKVMASDINEEVLSFAKRGIYKDNTLRNVPVPYLEKYFDYDGDTSFKVKDFLKNMITFRSANLLDDTSLIYYKDMDIVFCRNVIIYFDEAVKKKVIGNLYKALRPGGYLVIGHSESLLTIETQFKTTDLAKGQVYKKIS